MKKIFTIMLVAAAMASCSTSEVEFDNPKEIGFTAVANNISRAVVDGTVYPTSLDMYVYAWTTDNAAADANYIIKLGILKRNGIEIGFKINLSMTF